MIKDSTVIKRLPSSVTIHKGMDSSIPTASIFSTISAGSSVNIRPEQVIGAYYEAMGQEYPPFAFQIQREEVYGDQGGENGHRFVSLEEYGETIE